MEAISLVCGAGGPQLKRNPLNSAAMQGSSHSPGPPGRWVLVASVWAACATSPVTWRLAPSVIYSDRPDLPAVQVPDTFISGIPATIHVAIKYGGCTRRGPTEVVSGDHLVTVRLFDSILVRRPDDYPCFLILHLPRLPVVVRFSAPGPGVVRVLGTDTIEQHVVVR
jgi:hypothetical protein